MVSGFVADLFRSRDELLAENAMLRQQLIVASRKVKQPKFRPFERGLLVALSSVVKNWQNAVLLVKPDTVLRWHREGFRLVWKRKSKATKQRQPRISTETIELIQQMAKTNKTWGAERIRGELLKLGIRVAKRTIQRHVLAVRPPGRRPILQDVPPQPRGLGGGLRAGVRRVVHCAFGAPSLRSGRRPPCYSSTAWTACTPAPAVVRVLCRRSASVSAGDASRGVCIDG